MKNLSIAALALMSTSAFASDARVAAHQGNAGLSDDTAYRTYFSRTDNGKDSMWFDLSNMPGDETGAGAGSGILSGAYKADGRSMTLAQSAAGSTAIGYYAADGDTGYAVTLDVTSKDAINIGGGYGMTNGDTDMAFGETSPRLRMVRTSRLQLQAVRSPRRKSLPGALTLATSTRASTLMHATPWAGASRLIAPRRL